MNIPDVVARIHAMHLPPPGTGPSLLVDAATLPDLRARAEAAGSLAAIRERAATLSAGDPATDPLQPYFSGADAVRVAEAYALTGDASLVRWVQARVESLLAMETWFSPVHVGGIRVYDHVMANVAAQVAQCHDLLRAHYTPAQTTAMAARLRTLVLEPYLDGTGDDPEWWFKPGIQSNWKIMTCGETGLAMCAFAAHWPDGREALARSAQGVLELLDTVPPEGDWDEGLGYWYETLYFGLRFARALQRLSGGSIDLFQHPILQVTGDFLTHLTTPAARIYNFADCCVPLDPHLTQCLALLAHEARRGDWMRVARMTPPMGLVHLACDDPEIRSTPLADTSAIFPTCGVGMLRSDTGDDALLVGMKSAPSAVGHSHLDANSFIIEARGVRLAGEYPYWPQAHFLGFFDPHGPRWNFDGLATVGHSTLLVDGRGQTFGRGKAGHLGGLRDEAGYAMLQGDASATYPGLLTRFVRTIVLLRPDRLLIRDVVTCDGPRHLEWLLHYEGEVRDAGPITVVENAGVRLCITPLLADRRAGWRVSDVHRTSQYECSDTRQMVERAIRYRGFSRFPVAIDSEFLMAMRIDGSEDNDDWEFTGSPGDWTLRAPNSPYTVRPHGTGLRVDS